MVETVNSATITATDKTASGQALAWPRGSRHVDLIQNDVHVWACSLDVPSESVGQFVAILSPEERERAERFRFEHHRNRFIVGRGWLRMLLGLYLGIPAEKINFVYGKHGKPGLQLSRGCEGLQFNLAHSDAVAVAGVTRAGPIGLDVERIRSMKDADELVERFFSPNENVAFQRLSMEQKNAAFFNLWTRKEAWLKATGEGISQHLKKVEVSFLPGEQPQLLKLPEEVQPQVKWRLEELRPAPGFAGALAVSIQEPHINCWRWDERASLDV